jgi:hypothetical protein
VLSAADLNNEFTVWNFLLFNHIGTVASTYETPFFIRMSTFHSVISYNALTAFYAGTAPVMAEPIPGLFPFTNTVPSSMNTTVNRNIAVAFTLQRLADYFYPKSVQTGVAGVLTSLGLDPTYTKATNTTDPRDIGNLAAAATIAWSKLDGYNFESNEFTQWKQPYSDNTNAIPTNTAYEVDEMNRWQPLIETTGDGTYVIQTLIGASSGKFGKTVGLSATQLQNLNGSQYVPILPAGSKKERLNNSEVSAYKAQADYVLSVAANLTDTQKLYAEFFDGKARSFGLAPLINYFKPARINSLIKYLALDMHHIAIHDAAIVAWNQKIKLNMVRPITAIRYLYGKTNVTSFAGPGKGTKTYSGAEWQGYLRTMPHSEFPSGTACICVAYAEWIENWLGTPGKLGNFTWPFTAGCSFVEQGTPAASFTKVWDDKEQFIQDCANSRVYAGVHFKPSVDATVNFCRGVGTAAWAKVGPSIRKFM